MSYKNVADVIKLIEDIDTYGHAELVKRKMAVLQSLLEHLAKPVTEDATDDQLYSAPELATSCKTLTTLLKTNQAIFKNDVDDVAFDQMTTTHDDIEQLATAIAKKQAILLDKSASDFLDEKNIETVKSAVEKELAEAQTALDTASTQQPEPPLEPLQAKVDALTSRFEQIKKIETEAQKMKACREALHNAHAAQKADLDALKETMVAYNAAVQQLNESLSAYSRHAIDDNHKIAPPVPPPTRELSTARIAANWTVQVGVGLDGIGHGICTDKGQISQLHKLVQTIDNSATIVMNAGAGSTDIRRAALLETEIPYSVCNYATGEDTSKDATLLVIQEQEHNKVTDCSTNLASDQKRNAAIEMAKMYAINYQGGPVQIRGKDPLMAGMLHAALLTLLPNVEIRNYVAGEGVKPSWHERNSSFINKRLSGFEKELETAVATVAHERALAAQKEEKIAAVHEKQDSRLKEGFFGSSELKKARDPDAFKRSVEVVRRKGLEDIAQEDLEGPRGPTHG